MLHCIGGLLEDTVVTCLLQPAHHTPSVGFIQPWRFFRIRKPQLRQAIHALVGRTVPGHGGALLRKPMLEQEK